MNPFSRFETPADSRKLGGFFDYGLQKYAIEAIQRLRRAGSSLEDVEDFTGFGHGTIVKYTEGIEPLAKFTPPSTGQMQPQPSTSKPPVEKTDKEITEQYAPLQTAPEDAPYVKPPSENRTLAVERPNGEKPPEVTSSDKFHLTVNLDPETILLFAGGAQHAGKPLNAYMREDVLPNMQTIELLKEACPDVVTPQALQSALVDFIIDANTHRNMTKNARRDAERHWTPR